MEHVLDSYVIIDLPATPVLDKRRRVLSTKKLKVGSPSLKMRRPKRARAYTCLPSPLDVAILCNNNKKTGLLGKEHEDDSSSEQNEKNWLDDGAEDDLLPVVGKRLMKLCAGNMESNVNQNKTHPRRQGRARAYTTAALAAPNYQNSPKRKRSGAKRVTLVRRGTQSMTSISIRKKPIIPFGRLTDENSNPMPYLFANNGRWRKTSTYVTPGKNAQGHFYKRRLSTAGALLPGGNKIKLQELAKDELLASLNEPFNKQVAEAEVAVDERDVVDCAVVEEKDEMLQLTELKRVKVIEEIFETEKKYLECLETVDKVFRAPMLHEGIAQEKDIHALFPNCLSTIQECHSWFMGELENRMKCEEWQGSIGDILGKMAGPLKDNLLNVYTDYVNAFPKSVSTFSKCTRTSQKFRKFIENCYDKSDNLDLPSYLITPVQRLPRYVLLLRQLSKYTRDDHPDNESIKTALLQMEELIRSLNGSITSSMHIYTSRESENRKSVKRQSSKRRKKQRPVTLNLSNLKDVKTINDKLEKPNCNNNTANQNGISRVSQDKEEPSNSQGDQKLIEGPEKKSQSNKLDAPSPTHLQLTPSPIQLRKNKSEHRKSLRRSLGAALSSFWSPKDEKELKGINEKGDDKLTPTTTDNTPPSSSSSNSRRKLGVIHHFPPSSATNSPVEATSPSKSTSEDGVKRQRFSNSFRERTREFRIQMRRRSGTWSTAPIEDKEADSTMTSYASSSSTDSRSLFPAAANDKRPASATSSPVSSSRGSRIGSSLMSMFNKRKSKQQSDEDIHRRRSDSDRDFQLLKTPDDKVLSVSMSYPNFPNQRKDSKALSISSSICEESYDTNSEHCTNLSTIKDETTTATTPGEKETSEHDLTNGHVENGTFSDGTEGTTTSKSVTKKPKKGKIMRTLRHMMGKGKN